MKGMLIVIAVIIFILLCLVPIAGFMADQSFKHADRPWAPKMAANCGRVLILATSYTKGREVLLKTAQVFPQYPRQDRILFLVGLSYEKENDTKNAKQCYRQFLAVYPNHPWSNDVQKRLEEIEATGM